MKISNGTFRRLVLVTQIGFNMVVPIMIGGYLAGRFLSDNPIASLAVIIFFVMVSFRNLYKLLKKESSIRQKNDKITVGRPKDGTGADQDNDRA